MAGAAGAAGAHGAAVAHGAPGDTATGTPNPPTIDARQSQSPRARGRTPHTDARLTPDNASAARFLDALADRLALGVASVVALLDPGCVVLGGEVGQAGGDELAVRVAARIARMSPLPAEVRPSALGGAAVLRGALLTAQDGAQNDLFG